jgi:hypothetical protein
MSQRRASRVFLGQRALQDEAEHAAGEDGDGDDQREFV